LARASGHRRPAGSGPGQRRRTTVQTTRPRDLGVLALVVGLLLALFVVAALLGSPAVR